MPSKPIVNLSHCHLYLTCSIPQQPLVALMIQFAWFLPLYHLHSLPKSVKLVHYNSTSKSLFTTSFLINSISPHSNFPITSTRIKLLSKLIETQTRRIHIFANTLLAKSIRFLTFQWPKTDITRLTHNHDLQIDQNKFTSKPIDWILLVYV